MPSAKPSLDEIKALRKKRSLWHAGGEEDHLAGVRAVCLRHSGGGYITPEAAKEMLNWCIHKSAVTDTYPTSTLIKALQVITAEGRWTPEAEKILLRFITAYFIEDSQSASIALADIFGDPGSLVGDLIKDLFDATPDKFVFLDRFVVHTGKFRSGSRAKCFEQARALGSTPSDIAWYSDYLFVADEHVESRAISSKIDYAIYARARWGQISIFPESVWQQAIEEYQL
ncbi:MAG: hypothetical protein V7751_02305 [Pseudoalteromonas distincta]